MKWRAMRKRPCDEESDIDSEEDEIIILDILIKTWHWHN